MGLCMRIIQFAAVIGFLAFSGWAMAHHSDAGLDDNTEINLKGTVTDFKWRQPHVYISMDVIEDGEPVNWSIQLIALNILTRQGWSGDSLESGDEILVSVNPAINGKPYGKLTSIQRADGSPVAVAPESTEAAYSHVRTNSLDGIWTAHRPSGASAPPPPPREETPNDAPPCTSGFDCFFKTNLVLTDAAKQAMAAYDPLSDENPEATCIGRPTPAALVSARGYLLQFDLSDAEEKILIRSEWFNELRTIWMDGRDHPDASETLATGHSIGRWEGDTLVVDTRNFDNHRSPYQIGVPSGSQKHVVEKYRLNEDGRSMQVEWTLEDSEYIAEPLTHRNTLFYGPHLEMHGSDCDPENTGLFLK